MATTHAEMNVPIFDTATLQQLPPSLRAIEPEMIAAGLRDIEEQCSIVHNHMDEGDTLPLVSAMHSIKSCAAQLGGLALSNFAAQKEAELRRGVACNHRQVAEDLAEHIVQFKAALEAYQAQQVN